MHDVMTSKVFAKMKYLILELYHHHHRDLYLYHEQWGCVLTSLVLLDVTPKMVSVSP
jgi:hypothetical protein